MGLAGALPRPRSQGDRGQDRVVQDSARQVQQVPVVGEHDHLAALRVIGQRLIGAFDRTVARIPMVQTIYGGSKKLLELMQTKPDGTHRVVLIDFPHANMKTVGLVTRTLRDHDTGREYAAVYVPTTPNPTSGYLEIVPLDRVTPTDWTMDQAMAFIISGGAIAPSRFRFDAAPVVPAAPNDKD